MSTITAIHAAAALLLQAEPRFVVTRADTLMAQEQFAAIGPVANSKSAGLALAETSELALVLQPMGLGVRRVGGRGKGPGEFESIGRLWWSADTLWVTDPRLGRITLFTAMGRLLRTWTYPAPKLAEGLRASTPDGYLADGTELVMPSAMTSAMASEAIITLPVLQVKAGAVLGVVSRRKVSGMLWRVEFSGNGRMTTVQPFVPTSDWDVCPDGTGAVFVDLNDHPRQTYRITAIDGTADTAFVVTRGFRPIPPPRAVIDSALRATEEHLLRFYTGPGRREAVRKGLRVPSFIPPVSKVVCGAAGTVWLRGADSHQAEIEWSLLSSHGRFLGTAKLGREVDIVGGNEAEALAIVRDADAVPHLVRLYLRKVQ